MSKPPRCPTPLRSARQRTSTRSLSSRCQELCAATAHLTRVMLWRARSQIAVPGTVSRQPRTSAHDSEARAGDFNVPGYGDQSDRLRAASPPQCKIMLVSCVFNAERTDRLTFVLAVSAHARMARCMSLEPRRAPLPGRIVRTGDSTTGSAAAHRDLGAPQRTSASALIAVPGTSNFKLQGHGTGGSSRNSRPSEHSRSQTAVPGSACCVSAVRRLWTLRGPLCSR